MVPELYGPIYKGVFSDICPLLSTPDLTELKIYSFLLEG
jgi:hypothetical protein